MRRVLLWSLILALLAPPSLFAQTTTVRVQDSSTGAPVNVGDNSNKAIRVNLVSSTLLDGLEGSVDGLEGLITTTNSTLTTIDGRVDGLEAVLGTAADAAGTGAVSINAHLRQIATTGVPVSAALPAGTNNIGDVDVLTVPTDPFGATADAASSTGSISAKLRFIAATGIPITSSALPTGAATSANQVTIISHIDTLETVFGTAALVLGTQADAVANTADGLQTTGFMYGYNGTTWDRLRLGPAGTAASTFLSVQGGSGMSPIEVTGPSAGALALDSSIVTVNDTLTTMNGKMGTDATRSAAFPAAGPGLYCRDSDAAPTTTDLVDDDAVALWCDDNGRFQANISQINGVTPLMGNGASGTGAQRVTLANDSTGILAAVTNLSQWAGTPIPLLTATLADDLVNTQDALATAGLQYVFDGATWDRAPGNSVTGAFVGGAVADDVAVAGNPIGIGGLATTSIVGQTPATTARRIAFVGGADRVQITRPYSNLEDRVSGVVGITDGSSTSLVAAQGAGVRFCATSVFISNSSATNVTVDLRDGTAGSVIATLAAPANFLGSNVTLPVPLCTTANTALAADPSAAATTVTTTAIGFKTEL